VLPGHGRYDRLSAVPKKRINLCAVLWNQEQVPGKSGQGNPPMRAKKKLYSFNEAKQIGDALGIDWRAFGVEQFQTGLEVELEHGARDAQTDVTHDDPLITGKIALAHLKEFPDYYTRLSAMEKEADEYWANV